jgi:double-stranded uracil-DNA glycosylase
MPAKRTLNILQNFFQQKSEARLENRISEAHFKHVVYKFRSRIICMSLKTPPLKTHKVTELWCNSTIETLEDLVPKNPVILFIGINPSPHSVEVGHYHQGILGKRFWKRLDDYKILHSTSGLEDDQLLERGFGITDIVKRKSSRAKEVGKDEFTYGRQVLLEKIKGWKPRNICFIYKKAAEELLLHRDIEWRRGLIDGDLYGASLFHMPSPYASKEEEKRLMCEFKKLINL